MKIKSWETLTEEDADRRRSSLRTLLDQFDVPEARKTLTYSDLRWLSRNLSINNSENPMLDTVLSLVRWLSKWEIKTK